MMDPTPETSFKNLEAMDKHIRWVFATSCHPLDVYIHKEKLSQVKHTT